MCVATHLAERSLSHGDQLNRLVSGAKPESFEIPSRPVLGLPVKRVVPMDVHSVLDYSNGVLTGGGYFLAGTTEGQVASIALGASVIGVSLFTDYKLSAVKLIPIEVHETIDYVWSISAIAAPFVFGYWKKDPLVAISHVVSGICTIVGSLFTDYRAARGVGRSRRSVKRMTREQRERAYLAQTGRL
jgi:hypothetical protein